MTLIRLGDKWVDPTRVVAVHNNGKCCRILLDTQSGLRLEGLSYITSDEAAERINEARDKRIREAVAQTIQETEKEGADYFAHLVRGMSIK